MTETVGPICISKPCKNRVPFAFGGPTSNNEVEIRDKNEDGVGILWVDTYHTIAKTLFFEDAMKEGEKCCCGHCHHEEEKVEVVDAK